MEVSAFCVVCSVGLTLFCFEIDMSCFVQCSYIFGERLSDRKDDFFFFFLQCLVTYVLLIAFAVLGTLVNLVYIANRVTTK